jgi:hypothetical protein
VVELEIEAVDLEIEAVDLEIEAVELAELVLYGLERGVNVVAEEALHLSEPEASHPDCS